MAASLPPALMKKYTSLEQGTCGTHSRLSLVRGKVLVRWETVVATRECDCECVERTVFALQFLAKSGCVDWTVAMCWVL